ncbi:MAG: DUF484 family protein [Rhodobacteraceae bacterium]|jgi:hypothetical protein|nr:DUF484 family protein [Paracoccaceae bacterium]
MTATHTAVIADSLRETILSDPDMVLSDQDVMRALVQANARRMGNNVVDLRGIAMERLERRLDRLEETHRSVIAAAWENLASTAQLHRAVLITLEATSFEAFLTMLSSRLPQAMGVETLRLILETHRTGAEPALKRFAGTVLPAEPGFIADYVTRGRVEPPRAVTLRGVAPGEAALHGPSGAQVRSEACLVLDLGPGRLPGMLLLGADDPQQFQSGHGTDLLTFFGGVFERAMRRWLE